MPLKRHHIEVVDSFDPKPYEARGVRRWAVDVSFVHNGIPVRLQRRGFLSRGAALTFVETEIALIRAGVKSATEPKSAKTKAAVITVREALEQIFAWWRSSGRKKESTLLVEGKVTRQWLIPHLGDTPWKAITQAQIDALVSASAECRSPKHLIVLRSALRDSRRAGLEPPMVTLERPRVHHPSVVKYITPAELQLLCDHAPPLWSAVFRLLFHTGLRAGELLTLEWSDITWQYQKETLTVARAGYHLARGEVSVTSPKSGKSRVIPLNHEAVKALVEISQIRFPGRGVFVEPSATLTERLVIAGKAGGYMRGQDLPRALTRACAKAKIKRITPHVLRHSFGTALVQNKVDVYLVCDLMGHSNVNVTMRYAHNSEEGIRGATRALDMAMRKVKKKTS